MPRRKERGENMKAYVAYETIAYKEIEIPDKFAKLVEKDGCWSEEIEALWLELDEYADSKEFLSQCDFDGEICGLDDEYGHSLLEW